MNELLQAVFDPVYLLYTFLLIQVFAYWMSVILGASNFGSFDLELDVDGDADVDGVSSGMFAQVLHFFIFGKLPFMVVMSFIILFCWAISVFVNH